MPLGPVLSTNPSHSDSQRKGGDWTELTSLEEQQTIQHPVRHIPTIFTCIAHLANFTYRQAYTFFRILIIWGNRPGCIPFLVVPTRVALLLKSYLLLLFLMPSAHSGITCFTHFSSRVLVCETICDRILFAFGGEHTIILCLLSLNGDSWATALLV